MNSKEGGFCAVCVANTNYYCKECGFYFCRKCNITERHDGVFKCEKCQLLICNTYRRNETEICQFCSIKTSVAYLNEAIPGFGDGMVRELVDLDEGQLRKLKEISDQVMGKGL